VVSIGLPRLWKWGVREKRSKPVSTSWKRLWWTSHGAAWRV
jgi:hypothetical protein